MSKKLLKESTIRRFGALAAIKPASTSNFLKEFDDSVYIREEEEEIVDDEVLDLELAPEEEEIEDVELDIEEPVEVGGDAEDLVISLLDKVKEWAVDQGVEMDVEADEDVEDVLDFEEPVEDVVDVVDDEEAVDIEFEEEEDGLEEMINSILSEDDEEDETLQEKSRGDKTIDEPTGAAFKKGQETESGEEADSTKATTKRKKTKGAPGDKSWGTKKGEKPYNESRQESIKVVSDDKVIQEVTKRVKQRLARIAKARKRQ